MLKNILLTIFRNLKKNKLYFFFDVLSLVIGLTCSLLILLFINNEMSYDKFHENHENIYRVASDYGLGKSAASSPPIGPTLKADLPEVEYAARLLKTNPLITYLDARFFGDTYYYSDPDFFDIFSFELTQGDQASALNEPNTIVLTESTAKKLFGSQSPIGQNIDMNSGRRSLKVSGVLEDPPANSHVHFSGIISWSTFETIPGIDDFLNNWWSFDPHTYILANNSFSPEKFQEKWPEMYWKYMSDDSTSVEVTPILQRLDDIHLGSDLRAEHEENGDRSNLYIMGAILVFMILMSSINYMNMATSRSSQRSKEIGVRKVMGAYRGQLRTMFIIESLVMAFIALILSLLVAWLLLPGFNELVDSDLLFSSLFSGKVLLIVLSITLLIGLGSGVYPAFFLSAFNPVTALKGGSVEKRGNFFLRKGLIIMQFVIAFVMLVGILTVNRQVNYMMTHEIGFDNTNILGVNLTDYNIRGKVDLMKQEFMQHPAVVGATAVQNYPGAGDHRIPKMVIEYQNENVFDQQSVIAFTVDHDFIPTMGMSMAEGRNFDKGLSTDVDDALIVNETAAKSFGWSDPIGQKLLMNPGAPDSLSVYLKVVGVVKDFHIKSLHDQVEPLIMALPDPSEPMSTILLKVNESNALAAKAHAESTMLEQAPAYPFDYFNLETDYEAMYQTDKNFSGLLFYLALMVIFISCIGLFGLSSYTAEKRQKEVSIRKVFGAENREVIALLLKDFLTLVVIAIIIASPIAFLLTDNWLSNFAFSSGISVVPFIIAGGISLFISIVTTIYHINRVARTKPAITLKAD
jgi:putative ABC transport system permease protein